MNPVVLAQLTQVLGKTNLMHLLQVLMGQDDPNESEIKDLRFLLSILENPIAGSYAWKTLSDFVETKGYAPMVMGLLAPSLQRLSIETEVPENFSEARPAFVQLLQGIINNPARPAELKGITRCPECNFVYGLTT